jgi:hypothetical protein
MSSRASTLLLLLLASTANALVVPSGEREPPQISRRDILIGSAASLTSAGFICSSTSDVANAAENNETIDMAAINVARAKSPTSLADMIDVDTATTTSNTNKPDSPKLAAAETVDMDKVNAARSKAGSPNMGGTSIVPITDPAPMLSIRAAGPRSNVKIPRVGYSFYKTAPEQAARCTSLALRAGIRHLDVATSYHSNSEIAKSLKQYLDVGQPGLLLAMKEEKPELLQRLDATSLAGDEHAKSTLGGGGRTYGLSPAPLGSAGRRGRREGLFLSHKISNAEQSTDATAVRRSVKAAIAALGCSYLDMVSIHSPLTDQSRRMATYQTLLELRDSGFVKTVGVCK